MFHFLKLNFLNKKNTIKRNTGFSFVDVLVGISLTAIIFTGIFGAYHLGIKAINESRNKITATAVANQEIEKIINLPYQSIGIKDGELPVAEGILLPFSSIFLNNTEYFIERNIEYISDEKGQEFDCPLNYKRIEVKVYWQGQFPGELKMVSNVAPKNKIEEITSCQAQPGGLLSIRVFDAFGIMISSPLIEIFKEENQELIASYTPADGKKDVPLPTSTYKIIVSKNNYSTEETYSTNEVASPLKPNPIVLEGEKTEISFSIDKLSIFSINTFFYEEFDEEEENNEPLPVVNAEFSLRGEKLIGFDVEENPIYKYSQSHISDSQGQIIITELERDNYFFSIDPETGLNLKKIEPEPDLESGLIGLGPDINQQINLYLESDNSSLFIIKDDETLAPIFSASVRLHNVDLEYENLLYTDEKGRVLFMPLQVGDYDLEIHAPGYSSYQGQISVINHIQEIKELERIE